MISEFDHPDHGWKWTQLEVEFINKKLGEKDAEIERLRLDAERLDFLEHKLFGKKWSGVIDSGSKTYWQIWSGYQQTTHAMVGHTFRQAIDAARAALEPLKPCTSDEWLANCPQSVRDLANKIKQEKK